MHPQLDSLERVIPPDRLDNLPRDVKTQLLPVSMSYYDSSGWFARLGATGLWQRVGPSTLTLTPVTQQESVWLANALVGHRLPRRFGSASLEGNNLFDKSFNFYDAELIR